MACRVRPFYLLFTNRVAANTPDSQSGRHIGYENNHCSPSLAPRFVSRPSLRPPSHRASALRSAPRHILAGSHAHPRPVATKPPKDLTFYLVAIVFAGAALYFTFPSAKPPATAPVPAAVAAASSTRYASPPTDYAPPADFGGGGYDGNYGGGNDGNY